MYRLSKGDALALGKDNSLFILENFLIKDLSFFDPKKSPDILNEIGQEGNPIWSKV